MSSRSTLAKPTPGFSFQPTLVTLVRSRPVQHSHRSRCVTESGNGFLQPMELVRRPYKGDGTFEDEVGVSGVGRPGQSKWRPAVADVVQKLKSVFIVICDGSARLLGKLPEDVKFCANTGAIGTPVSTTSVVANSR